ncbi:MAG: hypothetical protein LBV54_04960 [Puniceicoccales bacterium]|jgi:hypothetical protein|nr:hypothetical protein [Puniceicoccales bacterium]
MAYTENPATAPAGNEAEFTAQTGNTGSGVEKTDAPASESPSGPASSVRVSESALEATHADLPPLSNIPGTTTVADNSCALGNPNENRPAARRGLGRSSGSGSDGSVGKPNIGVIEDPAAISESLSGQFANGYNNNNNSSHSARPRRERRDTPAPESNSAPEAAEKSGPDEFVPPVSQRIYKAEMDPDRERQVREDKRRDRGDRSDRGDRGDRNDRGDRGDRDNRRERREFFGERPEDRAGEWTPGDRHSEPPTPAGGGRHKLIIEPAKIPDEPVKESILTRIKRFFANLFSGKDDSSLPPVEEKRRSHDDKFRGGRGGYRRGGRGRGQGGGEFRSGGNYKSGGNSQSFNRDGHHRPHSRGGNRHHEHHED